jgi:hypothetical protein
MSSLFSPSTWPPISDLWSREHWDLRKANQQGYFPAPPGGAAPQVVEGALDYQPGGSSTSVYLDPTTTDPSEVSRQQALDFFGGLTAAPPSDPNPAGSNALMWVAVGIGGFLLVNSITSRR